MTDSVSPQAVSTDIAISALTALTALAAPDEFVIVDKSDTTMGVGGSTKRMPLSTFLADPVFLAALDARYVAGRATAWTTLPLTNGWVAYGANYTPQYRKVGDYVQIRGLAKDGAASGGMFQLPAGFLPYYEETFVVYNSNRASGISISVGGAAALQAGFLTGYCYLSGITFSTVA